MSQALYRKYRPRSLADVSGQEHITKTLQKAIDSGSISHAYLLTGPRGVGKTSIARILAHAINGLKYSDDSTHIDIIEIDAASNRRIDEIRDLREAVYIAPSSAKYKVYIIDEVHMLTKEAFNALLKTLEEPPAHIVFILATTDSHKLPATIISRTQRYNFKPIGVNDAVKRMTEIVKTEAVNIDSKAIEIIAEHSEGSLRDSLSLLDQVRNLGDHVTASMVMSALGLANDEAIAELISLEFEDGNANSIINALQALIDQGHQAAVVAKQLGQALRQLLIEGASNEKQILDLLSDLIEVPASHDPERYLEIVLLKNRTSNISNSPAPKKPKASTKPEPPKQITKSVALEPEKPQITPAQKEDKPKLEAVGPEKKTLVKESAVTSELDGKVWQAVLMELKVEYNTLYGIIRMASPSFEESNVVQLTFGFDFHKKRVETQTNKTRLMEAIKKISGQDVRIECLIDKNVTPFVFKEDYKESAVAPKAKAGTGDISNISNIFNGAELLES